MTSLAYDDTLEMLSEAMPDGDGIAVGITVEEQDDGRFDYRINAMSIGDFEDDTSDKNDHVNFQVRNTEMVPLETDAKNKGLMLFCVGSLSGPTDMVFEKLAEELFERVFDETRRLGWSARIPAESTFTRRVCSALGDAICGISHS